MAVNVIAEVVFEKFFLVVFLVIQDYDIYYMHYENGSRTRFVEGVLSQTRFLFYLQENQKSFDDCTISTSDKQ